MINFHIILLMMERAKGKLSQQGVENRKMKNRKKQKQKEKEKTEEQVVENRKIIFNEKESPYYINSCYSK